jgi:hypothetical protein
MTGDPWGDLSRRYRHDERAQFLFFVEQMAEARQLLLHGAVSRQRIGLVVVDNLAEILLHRQKRWIARLRRHHGDARIPRLDKEQLRELRGDFRARVALAMKGAEGTVVTRVLEPILDRLDADIFRTAHAYRGRVYHADHHNEAALPLIARAYLAAVGRAFVRQQPTGVASSPDATSEKICAYGFDLADSWSPGHFAPREAAEAITGKLSAGLGVTLAEAGPVLSSDLAERSSWAGEMIDAVAAEGLTRKTIDAVLAEARAWAEIEADEEVVRLEDEVAAVKAARYSGGEFDESSFKQEAELMEARNERVYSLRGRARKSITTRDIASVGRLGSRLTNAKNLGSLFERYRSLDEQMEEIEEVLEDMTIGWEERIQQEIDAARGK